MIHFHPDNFQCSELVFERQPKIFHKNVPQCSCCAGAAVCCRCCSRLRRRWQWRPRRQQGRQQQRRQRRRRRRRNRNHRPVVLPPALTTDGGGSSDAMRSWRQAAAAQPRRRRLAVACRGDQAGRGAMGVRPEAAVSSLLCVGLFTRALPRYCNTHRRRITCTHRNPRRLRRRAARQTCR